MAGPSYARGDTSVPLFDETIGTNLDRTVAIHGDRDALVSVHQEIHQSYREFATTVDDLAAGLIDVGIAAGDRVGIWSPNCAEWVWLQYTEPPVVRALLQMRVYGPDAWRRQGLCSVDPL